MKKEIKLTAIPCSDFLKKDSFVTVDNGRANGGYLAQIKEVSPQGMFSKISDGESTWDIMSTRLQLVRLHAILEAGKMIALPEAIDISIQMAHVILGDGGKCYTEWEESQCDGCKAGIPLRESGVQKGYGIHQKPNDRTDPFGIGCTAHLYDRPKLTTDGKITISLT